MEVSENRMVGSSSKYSVRHMPVPSARMVNFLRNKKTPSVPMERTNSLKSNSTNQLSLRDNSLLSDDFCGIDNYCRLENLHKIFQMLDFNVIHHHDLVPKIGFIV